MIVLVLSDFHLGTGKFLENGQINILEEFDEGERFTEFLEYYSSGKFYLSEVHLVLNGDILNLIQIPQKGTFSHIITEDSTIESLKLIHKGHEDFFKGLKKFLSAPKKKVTYVIGNHDAAMAWPKAQDCFNDLVGAKVEFSTQLNIHGIHIEHGHRFETINTVPPKDYFLEGPNGKEILNLPWGSLFCIWVLPKIKKDRPNIDKVRPMSSYIKWCFIHDFMFFWKLLFTVIGYFIMSYIRPQVRFSRNFRTTIQVLKQITIYPKYEKQAKRILRTRPHVHTVVMGHTHVTEWRKFPEGKHYFNTGTWNSIPSVDTGMHDSSKKLHYVYIDLHKGEQYIRDAKINVWHGTWRPYREDISIS